MFALVFTSSQSINMQERTWPESGHLNFTLGLLSKLHGQTCQFSVWANGKQNSGLINFILESCLPFVQISSVYLKMATKARKWYQICFEEKEHKFPFGAFHLEKLPFHMFHCSWEFSHGTT